MPEIAVHYLGCPFGVMYDAGLPTLAFRTSPFLLGYSNYSGHSHLTSRGLVDSI